MSCPLVIVGCGGFGREVFSLIASLSELSGSLAGFADDNPSAQDLSRVSALGSEVIGTVADLAARRQQYAAVVAIGSPRNRAAVVGRLAQSPVEFPVLVHPSATVGPLVRLGRGTVVCPGVRLSTNIRVDGHVHLDQNVTVGHDTWIGDFVRLNPQACISGSVKLHQRALVGANATVLPGLEVGADAVVGAAACVVANVEPSTVVKGVPAR